MARVEQRLEVIVGNHGRSVPSTCPPARPRHGDRREQSTDRAGNTGTAQTIGQSRMAWQNHWTAARLPAGPAQRAATNVPILHHHLGQTLTFAMIGPRSFKAMTPLRAIAHGGDVLLLHRRAETRPKKSRPKAALRGSAGALS
jgi:hypothetical protein